MIARNGGVVVSVSVAALRLRWKASSVRRKLPVGSARVIQKTHKRTSKEMMMVAAPRTVRRAGLRPVADGIGRRICFDF
jgi:hypothetical protein